MDNNEICSAVKQNIELLINDKKFDEAETLICEYKKMVPDDIEIYSMEGIIFMTQGKLNEAEEILKHGLDIDSCNFDLSYNLAYVYGEQKKYDDSLKYYEQALKNCSDENIKKEIEVVISKLENEHDAKVKKSKGRIIFFDKGDDKFIWGIINELSQKYETKHIRVTNYHQIDEGMQWADICWFEWCDELVIYGSKLPIAKEKKIICRLHRYEAFTNYIYNVNWNSVDKVIFVAKHIRDIVINKIKLPINKCEVIPNGINLNKFKYYEHKKGFNLAWIGYLNLRKNPMLVLQCFYELVKMDKRYQLYFAGSFQDESLHYYVKDIVKKLNLESNVHFDGFIDNDKMSEWLKNKNYIVTGSIAEGHPVGVMEAMASGLKPIIHYFPGVECFYPNKYIYLNKSDFIKMITENDYNSEEYKAFIENNYSLKKQLTGIRNLLSDLFENEKSLTLAHMADDHGLTISYAVPIYNGECYIRRAVNSILKQKIKPYEIILLDDNSNDNSYEILKKYKKNYPMIKILRNKSNLGEIGSTNKLFKISKGNFIKILHQDDFLYEDYSEVIFRINNIDEFSFIINDFDFIEKNNKTTDCLKSTWHDLNIDPNSLSNEMLQKLLVILGNELGGPSNCLFNKNELKKIDFWNKYEGKHYYGIDYLTFLKLIGLKKPLVIFKSLSCKCQIDTNTTNKYIATNIRIMGCFRTLKEFENVLNDQEKREAYYNLYNKSLYSIANCKDVSERKKMVNYILCNFKYLTDEMKQELCKYLV